MRAGAAVDLLAGCGFPVEVFFEGAPLVACDGQVHSPQCVTAEHAKVFTFAERDQLMGPACGHCLGSGDRYVTLLTDAARSIAEPAAGVAEVRATLSGLTRPFEESPRYIPALAEAIEDTRVPLDAGPMLATADRHFPHLLPAVRAALATVIDRVSQLRAEVSAAVLDDLHLTGNQLRLLYVPWTQVRMANSFTPRDGTKAAAAAAALTLACAGQDRWVHGTQAVVAVPDPSHLPWWPALITSGYVQDLGHDVPTTAATWHLFEQILRGAATRADALQAALTATA